MRNLKSFKGLAILAAALFSVIIFVNCSTNSTSETASPSPTPSPGPAPTCLERLAEGGTNNEWSGETQIQITGYTGQAMEPQIAADGLSIFFNDKLPGDTDMSIHYAGSTSGTDVFAYLGKLDGADVVNVMDGVPALDSANRFYFMSLRDYGVSSRYRSIFKGDIIVSGTGLALTNVAHADANLPAGTPPSGSVSYFDMDVGLSWDGTKAIVASTEFTAGNGYPDISRLYLFDLDTTTRQMAVDPSGDATLANINLTECKLYAPTMSSDKKELYYTALQYNGTGTPEFRILVAKRNSVTEPFGKGAIIQAISGYGVEGPSISLHDGGKTLYYHRRDEADSFFKLYKVTRP